MQKPCPGCGELKYANNIAKRKHGTAKCHGCVRQWKAEMSKKRITRSNLKRQPLMQLD